MREVKLKYFNSFTIIRDIIYNLWVIVLAAVIGFCGGIIYHGAFVKNQYTSSMTVSVNLGGYTSEATVLSLARVIQITEALQEVLQSGPLVDIVEAEIGDEITGTVNAVQMEETNLITISVTDYSPEKAYNTLVAVYDNYTKLTDSVFNNVIINEISNPNMPSTWSNKRQMLLTSMGYAVAAALICAAIITVISYFRDTVKNVSDVEDRLDTNLFGTICHINKRRSKIKKTHDGILLTNPMIDSEFSDGFRSMAVKLESLRRSKKIKSVAITSFMENEGKSTIAVNLAIALAELGKRVLLVDADFKRPAVYKFFGGKDYFKGDVEFSDYIKGARIDLKDTVREDHRTGVFLACGHKQRKNSSEMISSDIFKNAIAEFEQEYDIVLVDTPPCEVAIDAEIMSEITTKILFIVRQDFADVGAINDYLTNVTEDKVLGCAFNDVTEFKGVWGFLKADYRS